MREILFRGKRLDNGEWVYGNLMRYANGDAEIWEIFNPDIDTDCRDWVIIPDTVGQYTGLKDKNGVKIFEGDVINREYFWGYYIGYKDGSFVKIPLDKVQRINWDWTPINQEFLNDWEVVSNIHDNPELLEVLGDE